MEANGITYSFMVGGGMRLQIVCNPPLNGNKKNKPLLTHHLLLELSPWVVLDNLLLPTWKIWKRATHWTNFCSAAFLPPINSENFSPVHLPASYLPWYLNAPLSAVSRPRTCKRNHLLSEILTWKYTYHNSSLPELIQIQFSTPWK